MATLAGVEIPNSKLAREITTFIRDTQSELLFHHSVRVFLWAALSGKRNNVSFDPEILYAAAMFHDFGLTAAYHDSKLRFEVDGANAARSFLRQHQLPVQDIQKVWLSIALHTTPGIPEHMDPEIALVQAGAGMDVAGRNFDLFSQREREAVIAAHPRGRDFEHAIIDTFYEALKGRPETTFGTFNDDFIAFKDPDFHRTNICSVMLGSSWGACCT